MEKSEETKANDQWRNLGLSRNLKTRTLKEQIVCRVVFSCLWAFAMHVIISPCLCCLFFFVCNRVSTKGRSSLSFCNEWSCLKVCGRHFDWGALGTDGVLFCCCLHNASCGVRCRFMLVTISYPTAVCAGCHAGPLRCCSYLQLSQHLHHVICCCRCVLQQQPLWNDEPWHGGLRFNYQRCDCVFRLWSVTDIVLLMTRPLTNLDNTKRVITIVVVVVFNQILRTSLPKQKSLGQHKKR